MKKLLTLLFAFLTMSVIPAQNMEEQKKQIANIKKSDAYIYAEVTTTDQQQAVDLATEMLHNNINEWVSKKKKFAGSNKVITRNKNFSIEKITMPRANMYRAFMYVKKTDIIPANNVEVMEKNKKTTPSVQQKLIKPAIVEPIKTNRDIVIQSLLKVQNTGQLSTLLKDLKNSNKIREYNNLRGLKDKNIAEYIMIVFNKNGIIEAILSEGAERKNLKTGATDLLANYKGCGAIGVKVNK